MKRNTLGWTAHHNCIWRPNTVRIAMAFSRTNRLHTRELEVPEMEEDRISTVNTALAQACIVHSRKALKPKRLVRAAAVELNNPSTSKAKAFLLQAVEKDRKCFKLLCGFQVASSPDESRCGVAALSEATASLISTESQGLCFNQMLIAPFQVVCCLFRTADAA